MTSKALITITYSVASERMREFEPIISNVVVAINNKPGIHLAVYRDQNTFVEIYECENVEAFDALEDSLDEATSELVRRIATEFATERQSVLTLQRFR